MKESQLSKKIISVNKSTNITILLIISVFFIVLFNDIIFYKGQLLIPLLLSSIISTATTFLAIPKLKNLNFKQVIREEGPEIHHIKKNTPTLGGIIMIPIGITCAILFNISSTELNVILAISLFTVFIMLIGIVDDWLSITKKHNMGLNPQSKLFLQVLFGIIFLHWANLEQLIPSNINMFNNYTIDINHLIWPFALFVLIAESNATNLTDGLDGLMAGCGALIFTGLAIHLTLQNNEINLALSRFCISMAGASIGFLILNKNPAKIFMGDAGSLAIGSALAAVALISNNLWPLLIMGGVFLIETISVILQVGIFKLTKNSNGIGKRVFLMAPIHHHFELKGVKEHIIVRNFWILTLILIILSFFL